jgi:hypothetical protein
MKQKKAVTHSKKNANQTSENSHVSLDQTKSGSGLPLQLDNTKAEAEKQLDGIHQAVFLKILFAENEIVLGSRTYVVEVGHKRQKVGHIRRKVGHKLQKVGHIRRKVGHKLQKVGHIRMLGPSETLKKPLNS